MAPIHNSGIRAVMDPRDIVDFRKPISRWSPTPFIFKPFVCVCGSRIHAYSVYKINSDNFDPQALTQSLHHHFPLPHPCTWYVYLRQVAVVNILDLQAFDRIHPHHHHHQLPLSRLQQIYSYLRIEIHQEEESEEVCCVVCLAEFKKNDGKVRLPCEHDQFHTARKEHFIERSSKVLDLTGEYALTESLHHHFPLPHPCTWYVNLRVAAIVNAVDLKAFNRIHPHHHHHQPPPSRFERLTLQQIYSYLRGDIHQEEESEEVCCVVCHAEFKKNEMKGRLRCEHHQFHLDCIKEWLLRKNECPLCRRPTL
ncbi:hypothetical protein OSB04_025845 [Centaurea solstitialis]|uniref:RING-type E3 ubiquitin transferase n=1 Tax=Centaurea solstitialis TaxID=347529 RepID=A0AA38SWD4_9ASTR|nr:hypothetical protein OSB04_025845 [Centaurea solstitialis]